jgi:hypothetical protein
VHRTHIFAKRQNGKAKSWCQQRFRSAPPTPHKHPRRGQRPGRVDPPDPRDMATNNGLPPCRPHAAVRKRFSAIHSATSLTEPKSRRAPEARSLRRTLVATGSEVQAFTRLDYTVVTTPSSGTSELGHRRGRPRGHPLSARSGVVTLTQSAGAQLGCVNFDLPPL